MAAADTKKQDAEKTPKSPSPSVNSGKVAITPTLRKNWIRIRAAWNTSPEAFTGTLSLMDPKQANELYDLVKLALFKGSHVEILHEHPEMREFVKSDDDRLCMHDVYEALSRRLQRKEPFPEYAALKQKIMGFGKRIEDV